MRPSADLQTLVRKAEQAHARLREYFIRLALLIRVEVPDSVGPDELISLRDTISAKLERGVAAVGK